MNITLTRDSPSDQGTPGTLTAEGLALRTLELPWRDNEPQHSCIPVGVYEAKLFDSPTKGRVYLLQDVPGRHMIEIHSANFAGDVAKGWESQLLGCIAPGLGIGQLQNRDGRMQLAALNSRAALSRLLEVTDGAPITLTIKDRA